MRVHLSHHRVQVVKFERFRRNLIIEGASLFVLALGCASGPEPQPLPAQPLFGRRIAAHRIWSGGESAGFLVEVEFDSPGLGRRFLVHNAFRQNVGFVDAQGRAYRYRVSDGEAVHVATGTMEENLRAILSLQGPLQLVREN